MILDGRELRRRRAVPELAARTQAHPHLGFALCRCTAPNDLTAPLREPQGLQSTPPSTTTTREHCRLPGELSGTGGREMHLSLAAGLGLDRGIQQVPCCL